MTSDQKLKQLNTYQDTLDVFIHILILRVPSIFVLVNMILMIWLVQTIFSNNENDLIPRSLYFFNGFLTGLPLLDLKVISNNTCQYGYSTVVLKTFPNIVNQSINHCNLTKWKQSTLFCQKISEVSGNFSIECDKNQLYCSGICVNQSTQCPITNIRQIYWTEPLNPDETVIYTTQDNMYKYVISRQNKPTYLVGIRAVYQFLCANQFHYFDTYPDFDSYWNDSKLCGDEGFLTSQIYHSFDSMNTVDFLLDNGIWSENISKIAGNSMIEIGSISKLSFKSSPAECKNAEIEAQNIQDQVLNISTKPQFSKVLLIMSFILFTLSWAWLVAFYCFCQHNTLEKNSVVILLGIIQFIVISFVYYQNYKLLQIETKINLIASCIDDPIAAFQQWSFQISNRSPLISIMYACSCFLLLEVVSYFVNYCLYETYGGIKIQNLILNQIQHINQTQSQYQYY